MKRKKVIVSGVLCVSISIASVLCGCSSQTENKTGDAFIINNGGISAATRKEGPYLKWDKAEKR